MENFTRYCPLCESSIFYKNKISYQNAIKNNSICRSCAATGQNNGMHGRTGDKNPFFGKTHSNETITILKNVDKSYTKTKSFKEKISQLNQNKIIGTHGKSVYDIWVEKYGKDIADEKMRNFKNKQSNINAGDRNNMFGKPSPSGSGNGWSGWYNGWYFRSLRELTYMIKVIERFNLTWESGEQSKYKIPYLDYFGRPRNYYPDFIIENKYIVESKPKRLWNSDGVKRKKEAAKSFGLLLGLKYKLVDVGVLTSFEVKYLYDSGKIKFLPRYDTKYNERKNKNGA